MMEDLTHCFACGAYLAGSWTVHEECCPIGILLGPTHCPPELVEMMMSRRRNECQR